MKAENLETGQNVAIKLIQNVQKDAYYLRKILREVIILRKLSEADNNIYTPKLLDVILPSKCQVATKPEDDSQKENINYGCLTHIFLVMELEE